MDSKSLLTKILNHIFGNFLFYIGIFSIFPIFAVVMHINSPTTYSIKSIVEYQPNREQSFVSSPLAMGGLDDINDQLVIYKSRSNIIQLVEDLGLNYVINSNFEISNKEYFTNILYNAESLEPLFIELTLKKDGFVIRNSAENQDKLLAYNIKHLHGNNEIFINRHEEIDYINEDITLTKYSKNSIAEIYNRSIFVDLLDSGDYYRRGNLFAVTISSSNPPKAKSVIKRLNEIYINNSLERNSQKANASVSFLEARISEAEELLILKEQQLTDFQKDSNFFDNEEEIRTKILELTNLETKINEFQLQEIDLRARFNDSNPAYKNLVEQLNLLISQKVEIEKEISSLPDIERQFANLLREIELNQDVLSTLQNRKLEFAIIEVSTIGDAEVIDEPYISGITSSGLIEKLIISFVLGSLFIFGWAVFSVQVIKRITSPTELEAFKNIKLLNALPFDDGFSSSVIEDFSVNLEIVLNETDKVLFIGGALKGVGKSTCAKLTAEVLAMKGSKVLLIDNDYRRGNLHKDYNVERPSKKILSDDSINFEKFKTDNENLYVLPRPLKSSETSTAAIFNDKFSRLLEICKKEFDYVVLDTAPLLAVQQGLISLALSDLSFIVMEHKNTRMVELEAVEKMIASVKQDKNYFIYNKLTRESAVYGYYDYYNYKYYSSSYDYSDEK